MTLLPSIESPPATPEPPILISPPRPIPSTHRGSVSSIGTSPASYDSNGTASQLRPPQSPTLDTLSLSNGAQPPGLVPRIPRPGLGSRNASTVSLGSLAHKRISDFELGEVIGEGSYSIVHLATDKTPPHRQYAIKQLNKKHIIKERKVKYVTVEKETLARLDRHPGIVRLYYTFHDEHSLYFVLELAQNGEILKYLQEFGSFQVNVARFYAAQVLSALEYMHKKGVIHRDLKPENILLDAHMRVKITDFGTAKLLQTSPTAEKFAEINQSRSNSFVGTAQYVCPELLTAKPIPDPATDPEAAIKALPPPQAADFWAFGCVLYQFICGRTPFRAPNEYLIFQKITKLDYEFPDDFPEDAKDLIRKLLVLDPQQRLGTAKGVQELKDHPVFSSIDWSNIWTIEPPPFKTGITPPCLEHKKILALEEASLYDVSGEEGDGEEEDSLAADDTDAPSEDPRRSEDNPRPIPQAGPDSPSIPWPRNGNFQYNSNLDTIRGPHRMSASSEPADIVRPSSRSTNNSWYRGETMDRTRSRSSSQSRWSRFLSLPRSAMQKMKAPSRRKSLSRVVS
ncbi:kinase-like protein [Cystobasidium minutum MCA 4210]|uniref:kinase-like protein n=1 Tax=Cystobasidium minutum MCA 4210 TaxID=1397322 RepID=UPI0034CF5974|eukprot:jgi/Rhomi1/139987/e_gw1.1.647.1